MTRVDKHLVLSTGHITKDVADAFGEGPSDPEWFAHVMCHPTEFGWWVYVLSEDNCDGWAILPECLQKIFNHARFHGANWVLFDCDEAYIDELELYEW